MGTVNVNNIRVTPLKTILVTGGDVLHAIKRTDPGYVGFGEAYFSLVDYGVTKAWKRHLRMTLNLIVPLGKVRFMFVDDEGGQREEVVGKEIYNRLTVPPGLWFGFKGLAMPQSVLLNVGDIPHDPNEVEHKEVNELSYQLSNIESQE